MTIGERIKNRRLELGLTVDQLAEKLSKNRATVYRYESDEINNLPISIVSPLADALSTSPAYILGLEEDAMDNSTKLSNSNQPDNQIKPSYLEEYEKLFPEGFRMIRRAATDLSDKDKEKLIQIMKAYLDD